MVENKQTNRKERLSNLEKILPTIQKIDNALYNKYYATAIFISDNIPKEYNSKRVREYVQGYIEKNPPTRKF